MHKPKIPRTKLAWGVSECDNITTEIIQEACRELRRAECFLNLKYWDSIHRALYHFGAGMESQGMHRWELYRGAENYLNQFWDYLWTKHNKDWNKT